jgi:hypothetical protein
MNRIIAWALTVAVAIFVAELLGAHLVGGNPGPLAVTVMVVIAAVGGCAQRPTATRTPHERSAGSEISR